jgi:hypothetical protein
VEDDDPGEIAKGCALIRANFGTDPETLTDERWAMLFQQAVWLENFRLENMARILAKLFSPADAECSL